MSFYVSNIMKGAPASFKNPTSEMIYRALEDSGIDYTRVESDPGISMDDCLNIDRAFGVDTVKTILLTNRQRSKFWLYVTHARAPFVTRDFCAALSVPRVSFADEDLMLKVLGTRHGAATPFALIGEAAQSVEFVMDDDVAERESLVITDGDPCGFICIGMEQLFSLLKRRPIIIHRPNAE